MNCIKKLENINFLRHFPGLNIFLLPEAPKFTIIEVNEGYNAVSQIKREELIGKSIFEVFANNPNSNQEANLKNSLLRVLKEKVPHEMPVQKYDLRETGTGELKERYWLPKNIPVLDEDGSVSFIIHSLADVTDSILLEQKIKKASAILEKNQQHYYTLFYQNPDAVFSFDIEGNFLSANNALATLVECSLEEIYQMNFISFVTPEDLDKTLYHFGEASKGNPQRYEVGMISAKGKKLILNITYLPIVVENKIVGIYGIAKDITDFVNTQEELLKRNKLFEIVSQTTNIAIWEWDLLSNKITSSGTDFYKLLGYSLTEAPANEFWFTLIHPDDRERIQNRFKEILESPDIQFSDETYRMQREDKSYAYINDRTIISRSDQGQAIYVYGITNDISKIKEFETERELLISDLKQSNTDLKLFSHIMSHNLRAPIANLISLGNLIDESKIEDSRTRMLLEKYKETTEKLNDTVNDLLEILLIKNNQEIPKKEIELSYIFHQVVDSIENYINISGAEIQTDFSAGNIVYFNQGYLRSILLNLLTNAIKYRSPDRKLKIMINTENRAGHLFLHFSDNGLGIDLEKYGTRIFGIYQKFHNHPESKGLGLHIVANQVKAMGGEISVKSQEGTGTTFTIKFKN